MIHSQLTINDGDPKTFRDQSFEEVLDRINRRSAEELAKAPSARSRVCFKVFVGPMKHSTQVSFPREPTGEAIKSGVTPLAILAIIDRSLRLHAHPLIKSHTLHAASQSQFTVTDCAGQVFDVTVSKRE